MEIDLNEEKFFEDCIAAILAANPHLQLGFRMTGPLGIATDNGEDASLIPKVEPLYVSPPDSDLSIFDNAVVVPKYKILEAMSIKLKLPIELNNFSIISAIDKRFLHPYAAIIPEHTHIFSKIEVGTVLKMMDPNDWVEKEVTVTQEYLDSVMFGKFRFALS